jgi:hypothetical protein
MRDPLSVYSLAREFGVDAVGVEQAVSTAISVQGYSNFPDQEMKDPAKRQAFTYEVLLGIVRESKGRFPWVFRQGVDNMVKAGKTADDIHILEVTFGAQPDANRVESEDEWRIEPEHTKDAEIKVVE